MRGSRGLIEDEQMFICPDVAKLVADDAFDGELGTRPFAPHPSDTALEFVGLVAQGFDIERETFCLRALGLRARPRAGRQKRKTGNAPRKKGRAGKYGQGTHP